MANNKDNTVLQVQFMKAKKTVQEGLFPWRSKEVMLPCNHATSTSIHKVRECSTMTVGGIFSCDHKLQWGHATSTVNIDFNPNMQHLMVENRDCDGEIIRFYWYLHHAFLFSVFFAISNPSSFLHFMCPFSVNSYTIHLFVPFHTAACIVSLSHSCFEAHSCQPAHGKNSTLLKMHLINDRSEMAQDCTIWTHLLTIFKIIHSWAFHTPPTCLHIVTYSKWAFYTVGQLVPTVSQLWHHFPFLWNECPCQKPLGAGASCDSCNAFCDYNVCLLSIGVIHDISNLKYTSSSGIFNTSTKKSKQSLEQNFNPWNHRFSSCFVHQWLQVYFQFSAFLQALNFVLRDVNYV